MHRDTALVVIDVQAGNFGITGPIHAGDDLLSKISALIDRARASGTPVVYVQHCGPEGAIDEPGTPGLGFKAGGPSIGSAIAFKLASEGAKVVVVDILEEMDRRTAEQIQEGGSSALFVQADVSRTDEVKRAVELTRQEFRALHCLVNCAASYEGDIARNVVEISEEDWQHTLA